MTKYRLLAVSLAALVLVVGGFAATKQASANVTIPLLFWFSPNHGSEGASILVAGSNLDGDQKVIFSNGDGHDGALFNVPATGDFFSFVVPNDIQPACLPGCRESSHKLQPGQYQVHVENVNGVSNSITFTVDAN